MPPCHPRRTSFTDQTFNLQGRARDPTTIALGLSAGVKPSESIDRVLALYKEACGMYQYIGVALQSGVDYWEVHPLESEQQSSAKSRRHFRTEKNRLTFYDMNDARRISSKPSMICVDPG